MRIHVVRPRDDYYSQARLVRVEDLCALTIFMSLKQGGWAAWAVPRSGEAEGGAKVPGVFLESTDQSCVTCAGVVRRDGHHPNVIWRRLRPDQQLCSQT